MSVVAPTGYRLFSSIVVLSIFLAGFTIINPASASTGPADAQVHHSPPDSEPATTGTDPASSVSVPASVDTRSSITENSDAGVGDALLRGLGLVQWDQVLFVGPARKPILELGRKYANLLGYAYPALENPQNARVSARLCADRDGQQVCIDGGKGTLNSKVSTDWGAYGAYRVDDFQFSEEDFREGDERLAWSLRLRIADARGQRESASQPVTIKRHETISSPTIQATNTPGTPQLGVTLAGKTDPRAKKVQILARTSTTEEWKTITQVNCAGGKWSAEAIVGDHAGVYQVKVRQDYGGRESTDISVPVVEHDLSLKIEETRAVVGRTTITFSGRSNSLVPQVQVCEQTSEHECVQWWNIITSLEPEEYNRFDGTWHTRRFIPISWQNIAPGEHRVRITENNHSNQTHLTIYKLDISDVPQSVSYGQKIPLKGYANPHEGDVTVSIETKERSEGREESFHTLASIPQSSIDKKLGEWSISDLELYAKDDIYQALGAGERKIKVTQEYKQSVPHEVVLEKSIDVSLHSLSIDTDKKDVDIGSSVMFSGVAQVEKAEDVSVDMCLTTGGHCISIISGADNYDPATGHWRANRYIPRSSMEGEYRATVKEKYFAKRTAETILHVRKPRKPTLEHSGDHIYIGSNEKFSGTLDPHYGSLMLMVNKRTPGWTREWVEMPVQERRDGDRWSAEVDIPKDQGISEGEREVVVKQNAGSFGDIFSEVKIFTFENSSPAPTLEVDEPHSTYRSTVHFRGTAEERGELAIQVCSREGHDQCSWSSDDGWGKSIATIYAGEDDEKGMFKNGKFFVTTVLGNDYKDWNGYQSRRPAVLGRQ